MNDQFIPYELALQLKGLGYNEISLFCYDIAYEGNPSLSHCPHLLLNNQLEGFENEPISAPLWQQAFDWLDKEFGLFVSFGKIDNTRNFYYDFMIIDSKNRDYNDEDLIDSASRILDKGKYNTYEEARLECLKKLIEIITEQ